MPLILQYDRISPTHTPRIRTNGRWKHFNIVVCWRRNELHHGNIHIHEEIGMALSNAIVLESDEAKYALFEENHMTIVI
jgi:hypothetical protein